jgi:arginine deiminase
MTISAPVAIGDVRSETGTLRRVLVHRPGRELDRLTPGNAADLLFDDVVWPELAREEHDLLAASLAAAGVEVLYLHDLLAGVLLDPLVRHDAIERAPTSRRGPQREELERSLQSLTPAALAAALVGGLTCAEAEIDPTRAGKGNGSFAIAPLPNQMFVRDSSAWLGGELVLGAKNNGVRSREADLVRAVYAHHPVFADRAGAPIALHPDRIEGGDIFALKQGVVLVGVGLRTGCGAVESLAEHLFAAGFERVLAVRVPKRRASIHLDCLMTMVDSDVLLLDSGLLATPVVEMLPPGGRVESKIHRDLPAAIAAVLGHELRLVEVADEREQWTLAANTLALAPGRVIAYSRNLRTNEALVAAGIEVLPIPGEELSRGRGGPRCLTCPLSREPVPAP